MSMRVMLLRTEGVMEKVIHALMGILVRFVYSHDNIEPMDALLHLIHYSNDKPFPDGSHGHTQVIISSCLIHPKPCHFLDYVVVITISLLGKF